MSESGKKIWVSMIDCPCWRLGVMYPQALFLGWSTDPEYVEAESKCQLLRDESLAPDKSIFVRMAHSRSCVELRKARLGRMVSLIEEVYWAGPMLGCWWRWVRRT